MEAFLGCSTLFTFQFHHTSNAECLRTRRMCEANGEDFDFETPNSRNAIEPQPQPLNFESLRRTEERNARQKKI